MMLWKARNKLRRNSRRFIFFAQIIDMGKSPTDIRSLAVTRLCGISKPGNYLSSSSHLRILFKSDEELTDKGLYVVDEVI